MPVRRPRWQAEGTPGRATSGEIIRHPNWRTFWHVHANRSGWYACNWMATPPWQSIRYERGLGPVRTREAAL